MRINSAGRRRCATGCEDVASDVGFSMLPPLEGGSADLYTCLSVYLLQGCCFFVLFPSAFWSSSAFFLVSIFILRRLFILVLFLRRSSYFVYPAGFRLLLFALFFDLATSLFHLWFCYAFMVYYLQFPPWGSSIRFAYLYVFIISLLYLLDFGISYILLLRLFFLLCSLGLLLCCLLCCFRLLHFTLISILSFRFNTAYYDTQFQPEDGGRTTNIYNFRFLDCSRRD
jgi:hypothetical protein